MNPKNLKQALIRTYDDVVDNHTLQMAAALASYLVLSLFPALIFLSSIVADLPVPDLFDQGLSVMGRFLPADTMGLVRKILADVISPNRVLLIRAPGHIAKSEARDQAVCTVGENCWRRSSASA